MSKAKKAIVAAIDGRMGKKVQGTVNNFETKDGENVLVDFTGTNTKDSKQNVPFKKLHFAHYKAQNAAEALKNEVIAAYVPID